MNFKDKYPIGTTIKHRGGNGSIGVVIDYHYNNGIEGPLIRWDFEPHTPYKNSFEYIDAATEIVNNNEMFFPCRVVE